MAARIALRPKTSQGPPILDKLEQRTNLQAEVRGYHGTRRYHLNWDTDVDDVESVLDDIKSDWRDHLENWRED